MTDDEVWPSTVGTVGVIGLRGIGRSICRRLAGPGRHAGIAKVAAFDADKPVLAGLDEVGAIACLSVAHLVEMADLILLCLPEAGDVARIARSHEGLLDGARRGQIIVDHGWSSLDLTQQLATAFRSRGAAFLDAPIERSRSVERAVETGRLAVAIGGESAAIDAAQPALACFVGDIIRVGSIGSAQVIRQMGDLVTFQAFSALAEALVTARAYGIKEASLFDVLSKRHGEGAELGRQGLAAFLAVEDEAAEKRTSISEAGRRLGDAVMLARSKSLVLSGADSTLALLEKAEEKGLGDHDLAGLFSVMEPDPKDRRRSEERRNRQGRS